MIVTLLPLLVAANVTVNESDWKYGPEVIYDASFNSLIYPLEKIEETVKFDVSMKFKCRPKTQLSLSCLIHEPWIWSAPLDDLSKNKSYVTDESWVLDQKRHGSPFELNFDRNGLKEIVVSSSLDPIMVDIFKGLAEQLNVGADLPSIPISGFDIMENSTTGQCKTNFVISSNKLANDDVRKSKENSHEIVILSTMRVLRGQVKGIQKTRYMDKCPYRYDYYDCNWKEIGRAVNEGTPLPKFFFETELKSLRSQMTITEGTFTSRTEEIMIITTNGNKSTTAERRKEITVILYEIVPASGPLQKIDDPTTVSTLSIERLHSDSSE